MHGDYVLLIVYFSIAILVSFLCSILEAVLLSITPQFLALLHVNKNPAGKILSKLKKDINKPLTAILTLNTVAHTVGASGVGAQVIKIYGSNYLAFASAILTVLILFLSEIIPKTLGTTYWRVYAKPSAYLLKYLTSFMKPVIIVSEWLTKGIKQKQGSNEMKRDEMVAMTEVAQHEGFMTANESKTIKNILQLSETHVRTIMTPRSVIFSLDETITVEEYFHKYNTKTFSRIVVYSQDNKDDVLGFVLRQDILLAKARSNDKKEIKEYVRGCPTVIDKFSVTNVFAQLVMHKSQIAFVVNEYGNLQGIVTLEDIFEEIVGVEIIDESDEVADMQELAKRKQSNIYDKE